MLHKRAASAYLPGSLALSVWMMRLSTAATAASIISSGTTATVPESSASFCISWYYTALYFDRK